MSMPWGYVIPGEGCTRCTIVAITTVDEDQIEVSAMGYDAWQLLLGREGGGGGGIEGKKRGRMAGRMRF